ncbi:MAG: ABC transporter ATP-binding protein, partial [Anaerolineales bacterium]
QNLFEFQALPSRNLSSGRQWTDTVEEIEFKNVSFTYPKTTKRVLNGINIKIRRGESLALVGKNGAGKTTIAKLMCRLYEPTSGEIFINGEPISEYSPISVQDHITILFQDYGDYQLTVKNSIGIGRIFDIENQKGIEKAARLSGIDTLILSLPKKYETMLGRWFEDGVQLSGGEWQKIALARAIFRDSDLLILDEPTASLDAESESRMFSKYLENNRKKITVLISHRFSTVRMANHILVIDGGECVESGSHEELMSLNGQYAYLFNLQAKGYQE